MRSRKMLVLIICILLVAVILCIVLLARGNSGSSSSNDASTTSQDSQADYSVTFDGDAAHQDVMDRIATVEFSDPLVRVLDFSAIYDENDRTVYIDITMMNDNLTSAQSAAEEIACICAQHAAVTDADGNVVVNDDIATDASPEDELVSYALYKTCSLSIHADTDTRSLDLDGEKPAGEAAVSWQ